MEQIHIGIIGLVAGTLTTLSFVPQIVKIARTRHVRDISLHMYVIMTTGTLLWLTYGILIKALPVILANCVSVLLCLYVVAMKLLFGRKDAAQ